MKGTRPAWTSLTPRLPETDAVDPAPFVRAADGGTDIRLKIVPGGSRNQVLGSYGDRLRVKVAAPPEGGKANRAVIALLAGRLGVPARALRIVRGTTNPQKTVHAEGMDPFHCAARLAGDAPTP